MLLFFVDVCWNIVELGVLSFFLVNETGESKEGLF